MQARAAKDAQGRTRGTPPGQPGALRVHRGGRRPAPEPAQVRGRVHPDASAGPLSASTATLSPGGTVTGRLSQPVPWPLEQADSECCPRGASRPGEWRRGPPRACVEGTRLEGRRHRWRSVPRHSDAAGRATPPRRCGSMVSLGDRGAPTAPCPRVWASSVTRQGP